MQTDSRIGGRASAPNHRLSLVASISLIFQSLASLSDPAAKRRVRWTPLEASVAAVLMVLDADRTLQGRFRHARSCLGKVDRRRGRTTYNGLLKALERQESQVLPRVKTALRQQVRRRLQRIDPAGSWLLLAVDGSKEELPRTLDCERVFGIADNGACPQAFVTAVVEVHTGLPWDWRIGRARASEKKHLLEMADALPADALLLGDGAFVGLPIWSKLNQLGHPFLIRVGGNVHLLTDLWPRTIVRRERNMVYVWPKNSRKNAPPLRLRLLRIGSGPKAVHLLTNVLDSRRLSRKAAGLIYRKRWGVELFYRTLKQTLGCAKLRSKAARRARLELEWTLAALTVAVLLGIDALRRGRKSPKSLSMAALLSTLREALRGDLGDWMGSRRTLNGVLADCVQDAYPRRRPKRSRHRPRTGNTPKTPLQPPVVRKATTEERREARQRWLHAAA